MKSWIFVVLVAIAIGSASARSHHRRKRGNPKGGAGEGEDGAGKVGTMTVILEKEILQQGESQQAEDKRLTEEFISLTRAYSKEEASVVRAKAEDGKTIKVTATEKGIKYVQKYSSSMVVHSEESSSYSKIAEVQSDVGEGGEGDDPNAPGSAKITLEKEILEQNEEETKSITKQVAHQMALKESEVTVAIISSKEIQVTGTKAGIQRLEKSHSSKQLTYHHYKLDERKTSKTSEVKPDGGDDEGSGGSGEGSKGGSKDKSEGSGSKPKGGRNEPGRKGSKSS